MKCVCKHTVQKFGTITNVLKEVLSKALFICILFIKKNVIKIVSQRKITI